MTGFGDHLEPDCQRKRRGWRALTSLLLAVLLLAVADALPAGPGGAAPARAANEPQCPASAAGLPLLESGVARDVDTVLYAEKEIFCNYRPPQILPSGEVIGFIRVWARWWVAKTPAAASGRPSSFRCDGEIERSGPNQQRFHSATHIAYFAVTAPPDIADAVIADAKSLLPAAESVASPCTVPATPEPEDGETEEQGDIDLPHWYYQDQLRLHLEPALDEGALGATLVRGVACIAPVCSLDQMRIELESQGWTVNGISQAWPSAQILASRTIEEGGLSAALAPFLGTAARASDQGSGFTLTVEEGEGSGELRSTFAGRPDFTSQTQLWNQIQQADRAFLLSLYGSEPGAPPPEGLELALEKAERFGPPSLALHYAAPGVLNRSIGWPAVEPSLTAMFRPGARNPVRLLAEHVQQPDLPDDLDVQATLERLIETYKATIPDGPLREPLQPVLDASGTGLPFTTSLRLARSVRLGHLNNLINGTAWACGWYQLEVLQFLHSQRALGNMRGLDYGPITPNPGHEAVVVYPSGTDWRSTGTVLDPWPNQTAEVFTMSEWFELFPGAHLGLSRSGAHPTTYPHLVGGEVLYPVQPEAKVQEQWRQILVFSPVDVLITAADGARIGRDTSGELVYEMPGAYFYVTELDDGTTMFQFSLPEATYDVSIVGNAPGEFHLITSDGDGVVLDYGANEISTGEEAVLSIDAEITQPMRLPDGSLVEAEVIDIFRALAADGAGAMAPGTGASPSGTESSSDTTVLVAAAAVALVVLAAAGLMIARARTRRS